MGAAAQIMGGRGRHKWGRHQGVTRLHLQAVGPAIKGAGHGSVDQDPQACLWFNLGLGRGRKMRISDILRGGKVSGPAGAKKGES